MYTMRQSVTVFEPVRERLVELAVGHQDDPDVVLLELLVDPLADLDAFIPGRPPAAP